MFRHVFAICLLVSMLTLLLLVDVLESGGFRKCPFFPLQGVLGVT